MGLSACPLEVPDLYKVREVFQHETYFLHGVLYGH